MSLYNFIYNLQRKSPQHKKRVLIGLLVTAFIILVVFWVSTFRTQISQTSNLYSGQGTSIQPSGLEKMTSPVAALISGFKNLKSDITDKIKEYSQKIDGPDSRSRPVYELPRN